MRFVWTVAALLVLAAGALAFWPAEAAQRPLPVADAVRNAPVVAASAPAALAPPIATPAPLVAAPATPASARATTPTAPLLSVGPAAKVDRLDAQSVRLDDRFTLRGSGSERDPYQLTWELLASAHESIDATTATFVLPGRLAVLRGAWVQISGYWAPPLQVFEAKELMVMLNKWDGCCIGLPPTPFDSIEATLANPLAVRGQHLFRYGTLKGRLQVEPFAAGGFLLGLYRLQDAVLESSS